MRLSLLIITLFIFFSFSGNTQVVLERQVIGSSGNSSNNGNVILNSTVGETLMKVKSDGNLIITEGFHQPLTKVVTECLVYYTGITPNGDGYNDKWKIDGITNYPTNTVSIFTRTGSQVWNGEGYDNKEVCFMGLHTDGSTLPDGTYFFVIENIPKCEGTKNSGWIDITTE